MARNGHTGRSLAAATGLHPATLSKVLNGHQRLSIATAARVAAVLGKSPDEIGLASCRRECGKTISADTLINVDRLCRPAIESGLIPRAELDELYRLARKGA